jgi:hypothetical protein
MRSGVKQNWALWIVVPSVVLGVACNPLWAYFHEVAKLVPPDAAPDDFFGDSVSTSGDYAIVGAPMDDDDGTNSGSSYIYQTDGTTWTLMQKITASDAAAGHHFGQKVSMDGFYAIVGAPNAQGNERNTGAAYVFCRQFKSVPPDSLILVWEQKAKLIASDGQAGDFFGHAVAINDKYAVVAAPCAEDPEGEKGAVYIFARDGSTWTVTKKITTPVMDEQPHIFGVSVSLSGQALMVGEWWDYYGISAGGRAHILRRKLVYIPPDVFEYRWVLEDTVTSGTYGDGFGYSTSMDGQYAIVGAPMSESGPLSYIPIIISPDYSGGADPSIVATFENDSGNWNLMNSLAGKASDGFGQSVALYGDYAVVGIHGYDFHDVTNTGAAHLLRRFGSAWAPIVLLTASDYQQYDHFGRSVCISRDYILVGAPLKRVMGKIIGAAYVFKVCPSTDLNYDCSTDFRDLAIFSSEWLR